MHLHWHFQAANEVWGGSSRRCGRVLFQFTVRTWVGGTRQLVHIELVVHSGRQVFLSKRTSWTFFQAQEQSHWSTAEEATKSTEFILWFLNTAALLGCSPWILLECNEGSRRSKYIPSTTTSTSTSTKYNYKHKYKYQIQVQAIFAHILAGMIATGGAWN